jgi:hypothetical protein
LYVADYRIDVYLGGLKIIQTQHIGIYIADKIHLFISNGTDTTS